jgi:HK97 gp10 family phage protein
MSITFDVDDPAVKTKIATLPDKMLEYAFETLLKQAELIKGLAQIYVPVDTGALRDSIRIERGGEGKQWRQVSIRAGGYVTNPKTGRKVDYAGFQEFGTRYINGQLFLTRAVEEVQPTIAEMIKANVVEKVKE